MSSVRVLVVEDEKKMASFIRKALLSEGFSADVLHHGDAVVPAASATAFDVIVLDIMLPGLDGIGVLRQLTVAKYSHTNTPVDSPRRRQ
jgi:two-component system OmpR family response regulator